VAALILDELTKAYGAVPALERLSIALEPGTLLTVLGPSGSGKSTALRLIAGLEEPDHGRVVIDGRDVTRLPPAQRSVGMVFQSFALFPHLSVSDNIGFGLSARGVARAERDRQVRETAAWLGLEPALGRLPAQISGGERQRVALARALLRRPRVLLLDEPLSNLDAPLREQARTEIRRVHAELGATTVYVTHDQAEALALGDLTAVVESGRLQQLDRPEALYERPASRFVAAFVGSPPMNLLPVEVADGRLRAGPVDLPIPPGASLRAGEELVAGFRPEDARPSQAGGFRALLEVEERVGHERLWRLAAGSWRFAVRPGSGAEAATGEEVAIDVDPARVRLFDAATGAAR
jgi:ABC-type sugar transport system ATPase subunit